MTQKNIILQILFLFISIIYLKSQMLLHPNRVDALSEFASQLFCKTIYFIQFAVSKAAP
jgi:hypothetical protein